MSDNLQIEVPLGDLLRKHKLKGVTSKQNTLQPTDNDEQRIDKSENFDKIQIIANRFKIIKSLGSGGFGEV